MSKKIFRKAAVIALSVATIMTFSFASVFADDVVQSKSAAEGTDAEVYLTLDLTTAPGTKIPAQTHKFVFVQDETNSVAVQALDPVTVTLTEGGDASTYSAIVSGDLKVYKQSGQIATGSEFSQPGLYTYTVRETKSADNAAITWMNREVKSETTNNKYSLSYGSNAYEVHFYVAKAADGKCYIKAATASKTLDWNGADVAGTKIDPSVTNNHNNSFVFKDVYSVAVGNTAIPWERIQSKTPPLKSLVIVIVL